MSDDLKQTIRDNIKTLEPKRVRLVFAMNSMDSSMKEQMNLFAQTIDEIDGYSRNGKELVDREMSEKEIEDIEKRYKRLSDLLEACNG